MQQTKKNVEKPINDAEADFEEKKSRRPSPNHISYGLGQVLKVLQPINEHWARWSTAKRVQAVLVMLPLMIVPLTWTVLVIPWLLLFVAIVYSAVFGWEAFVIDVEEAIQDHNLVSQSTIQRVQEGAAEKLQSIKSEARFASAKFGNNLIDMFCFVLYSIILYAMKALELITSVQQLLFFLIS